MNTLQAQQKKAREAMYKLTQHCGMYYDTDDVFKVLDTQIAEAYEAGRKEGYANGFMNGAQQGFTKEEPKVITSQKE